MQATSQTYTTLLGQVGRQFEHKVNIAGTDYFDSSLLSVITESKVFQNSPTIGGVFSGTCEFSFISNGAVVPRMAKIKPYFRLSNGNTNSEWVQNGEYYIDTRSVSHNDDGIEVFTAFCYDALMLANADYSNSSLTWPATDTAVIAEICTKLDITQDSRNASLLNRGYQVPMPVNLTMRDVLSYIAVIYAGNWIMNDTGQLRFVPINGGSDTLNVGKSVANLNISDTRLAYTNVVLTVDDNTAYNSGFGDKNVMEAFCPYATQAVADYVYSILSVWQYKPFSASCVWSNPAVELGDQISVVGTTGAIYSRRITYSSGMTMDLEAPNNDDIDHEIRYISPEVRRYTNTVKNIYTEISNANGEITLLAEKVDHIGGRNLIVGTLNPAVTPAANRPHILGQTRNTDAMTGATWSAADITVSGIKFGHGFRVTNTTSVRPYIRFGSSSVSSGSMNGLVAGKTYTFSARCQFKQLSNYSGSDSYEMRAALYTDAANPGNSFVASAYEDFFTITPALAGATRSKNVTFTFTVPAAATMAYLVIRCRDSTAADYGDADYIDLRNTKLEEGMVATAWSPAPEDQVGNDEIISKINISPEQITINSNKISLEGKVIDLNAGTGITITSPNFSVDSAGLITATGANISGTFTLIGGISVSATDWTQNSKIEINGPGSTSSMAFNSLKVNSRSVLPAKATEVNFTGLTVTNYGDGIDEKAELTASGLSFGDSNGNISFSYPASGLAASDLVGNQSEFVSTSGTAKTYTLATGQYLVCTTRMNNASTAQDGVWIVSVWASTSTSHISAILSPSGSTTASVSGATLTVTTGSANVRISIVKLG